MIKNKLLFNLSVLLFIMTMILFIHYPHQHPLGEIVFLKLHLPIRLAGGYYLIGILGIFFSLQHLFFSHTHYVNI